MGACQSSRAGLPSDLQWNVVAGLRDLSNALVEQAAQAQLDARDYV